MPRRITRTEALARLPSAEEVGCLICALQQGRVAPAQVLERHAEVTLVLTAFPVRWGHAMVLLRRHVERFESLEAELWQTLSHHAWRLARAIEQVLAPPRCYVASLGTALEGIAQSSPHLHLHVVPLAHAGERPRQVLTWRHGVYAAEPGEWSRLGNDLRAALRGV